MFSRKMIRARAAVAKEGTDKAITPLITIAVRENDDMARRKGRGRGLFPGR